MTNDFLGFAVDTAMEAGETIRRRHGTITAWNTKEGRGDIVTEVDTLSETLILERIRKTYPDHNIVTEESGKLIRATAQKNLPGLPVELVLVESVPKTRANKWRPVVTRVIPPRVEHVD